MTMTPSVSSDDVRSSGYVSASRSAFLPFWNQLTWCVVVLLLCLSGGELWSQTAYQFPDSLAVSTGSSTQTISVAIAKTGTIASIKVLTSGIENLDYTLVTRQSCVGALSVGQGCAVSVQFQPTAPGLRSGAVVLLGTDGSVMGTRLMSGLGLGPLGVFVPGTIDTAVGNGFWVYTGDDNPALSTPVYLPMGVAVDGAGNIFVSDSGNNRIRRVDVTTHLVSTVAGNGTSGTGGDGTLATLAQLNGPSLMAMDGAGNIYFSDTNNNAVRKYELATGVITTVAGKLGQSGFSGEGGPATSALLNGPEGVALDPAGNLYIVDSGNNVIDVVDANTGIMTRFAGNGAYGNSGDGGAATAAMFAHPWGIAFDLKGALYVADFANYRVRRIYNGTITAFAGSGSTTVTADGLPALQTTITNPSSIVADVAGNIYIADSVNNVVRKVNASTGISTIIAGSGSVGFSGDKGSALQAGIYGPYALTLDSTGNLYIADMFHNRIRVLYSSPQIVSYDAIRVGRTSPAKNQTYENDGNATLTISSLQPDQNANYDTATTTCLPAATIQSLGSCVIAAEFMPQTIGSSISAQLLVNSNAANSPGTIEMVGESDALDPTTTTLTSSPNPSALGDAVTLTAQIFGTTVSSSTGDVTTSPSGNVRFYDGSTLLGTVASNSAGLATLSLSTLTLGSHNLTANFTGDATDNPSTSSITVQVVKQRPSIVLTTSAATVNTQTPVTFTVAVSATQVTPTGTVSLVDGGQTIASRTLENGTVTFQVSTLTAGTHTMTAVYAGDAQTLNGTSNTVTETVDTWKSTVLLGANPTTADIGTSISSTISVISSNATLIPTGSVVLKDGSATLQTLALDAQGVAAPYATTALTVGQHTLTASYAGDSNNAAGISAPVVVTINKISTTTKISSSQNPASGGASLVLQASVTPASTNSVAGSLSGTVTFMEGSTVLGTGTVTSAGVATLTISSLTVGSHTITASYSGNDNYAASNAESPLIQVIQLAQTKTELTSSLNPSIAGNNVTLTAVVSGDGAIPAGTVAFMDGALQIGIATLNSGGQATFATAALAAGTHALTAVYSGDAKDATSTSTVLSQLVKQATTQISLVSSSNPATAGTSITFLATLSSDGGLPTGSMTLREGATTLATSAMSATGAAQFTLSTLSVGTHTLTAEFAGDANHAASISNILTQVVNYASSGLTITTSQNPSVYGTSVLFTANVTGEGQQPTGSVIFSDNGTVLGTQLLSTAGVATYSTANLTIGTHTITATYTGDTTHQAAAPKSVSQSVVQQTTTALSSSLNPSVVGNTVRLTASVTGANQTTMTGSVVFTDGGTAIGTAVLTSSGTAVLDISTLTAGIHQIVATYSGDNNNEGSTSRPLQQTVNTAGTSVVLRTSGNPAVQGSNLLLTASVTSTGNAPSGVVTFLDGSGVVGTATVASGIATLSTNKLLAGQHALTARYDGDSGTQSSTSNIVLQIIQAPTATALSVIPTPALTAETITLTATVSGGSSATGNVIFLDGSNVLGTAAINAAGVATLPLASLAAGTHSLTASYSGDSYNLASTSVAQQEVVSLRPSVTTITASASSYTKGQQVTLVAAIQTDNVVTPSGTVRFYSGNTLLGTATVTSASVATLIVAPTGGTEYITAVYSGDTVYSGSSSASYTLTEGTSTTFDLTVNPSSISLVSGAHTNVSVTIQSNANFSDTLALGCLDIPKYATCTFSESQVKLNGNGTATVNLNVDTGTPLGAGASVTAMRRTQSHVVAAGIFFPLASLFGLLLYRRRKASRFFPLVAMALLLILGMGLSGCGNNLDVSKTAPGNYVIRVVASGTGTGVSQMGDLTVTVK